MSSYALISNFHLHLIPKDIATDPKDSVTRSRININQLPACGFPQIQLFLEVLELGLSVAELGPVVVPACGFPQIQLFWKYLSWVSLSQNWVLS
jgi:hypothetical protein